MPQAIALVATFAATLGTGVVASTAIYYGVSAALYLGISIGLQYLAQLFQPSAPKPEDVQYSPKQPAQPRIRHYGRVKVSGPWVFGDSKYGVLHKLLALGQGPLDAIEQYWFDDKLCVLDGDGWVTNHWDGHVINIQSRLGATPNTAYGELTAQFPEWTSAHRGDGVASLLARQVPVEQENFLTIFPNGADSSYRVVLRGARVKNLVSGATAWFDNAAAIIQDYMTHSDGMRLPPAIFNTPQAIAAWQASQAIAAQAIGLKAGGTEPRYRLWGSYYLNERPADVLGRMLLCSDGRLYPTADGGLGLDIGEWTEPTVILDEDAIVGFSDFARGKDILATANTVRATYTAPDQDYQSADADPWVDGADVAARGEIELDMSFIMSPSHSQTRRLMKLAAWRANPTWIGNFQCNLRGLAALGERFVRIRYSLFGIDDVFEVQNAQIIVGESNILQGITFQLQSMPQAAYQWTAAQEEGDAPVSTGTTVDRAIPVPTGFDTVQILKNVSGQDYPFARLSWIMLPDSLRAEAHGRKVGEATWQSIPVAVGETSADSFMLEDGSTYEFQIRAVSGTGRRGEWTASDILAVAVETIAPKALTSFGVTGGNGRAVLSISTAAGDTHLKRIGVYRVPTGVPLNVAVHTRITLAAAPGTSFSYTDGDATITNILSNGDFATDTVWIKGTGWTIAAGLGTHAAGAAGNLQQTGLSAMTAVAYRIGYVVSGRTTGVVTPFTFGVGTVFGPAIGANGQQLATTTPVAGNTSFAFNGDVSFNGSVDSAVLYRQTAACAPQGIWDYYALPENGSGVTGPQSMVAGIVVV